MLTLEILAEVGSIHQGELETGVKQFAVGPSRVLMGGKHQLMGVINLSPDSWYRESVCANSTKAIERGRILAAQGAAIVDVGTESTIPGAALIDEGVQLEEVLPVIKGLSESGVAVSIETYNAKTAARSLEAGAAVINLTGPGEASGIYAEVARADAAVVICFVAGENVRKVESLKLEEDPMPMFEDYFSRQLAKAEAEGVQKIFIDPGLGFYYQNLNDGEERVRYQMKVFLNTFRLRKLGWPICHALPHAFDFFQDEVRSAEPFFAVLAALGKTSLFRTHEVSRVKAVLDTLAAY